MDCSTSHAPLANSGSMPVDPGFKSNKSFAEAPHFSGKNGQAFQPWTVEFLAPAEVVGELTTTYASSA